MKIILSNSTRGAYHGVEAILKKNIANGLDNIVLVPDRFTASVERGIMQSLELESLFNVQVMSFTRLANKLIGSEIKKCLTPEGSVMLLSHVIEQKRDELEYYNKVTHTEGFAGELYAAITSIRNSGISSSTLMESSKLLPSALRAKAHDIALIYQGYLEALEEKHSDSSTRLEALAKYLKESNILNKHFYCIDFYDYKVPELEILRGLSKVALSLTIGVVSGFDNANKRIYQDRVFQKLQAISEDKVEVERCDEKLSQSIDMLSKHLFSYSIPSVKVENNGKVKLREAKSRYDEVLKLALDIISKVRAGARYRDFEIFATDLDDYGADIKSTFLRYNIPFFIDKKALLQEQSKVRFLLSAISTARSGLRCDEVFEIVKNPLFINIVGEAIVSKTLENPTNNKDVEEININDEVAEEEQTNNEVADGENLTNNEVANEKNPTNNEVAEENQTKNEVAGAEAVFKFENYALKYSVNHSQFDALFIHTDDEMDIAQIEIVREVLLKCVSPFRLGGDRKIQEYVKATREFFAICENASQEHIKKISMLSAYYRKCTEQVDDKMDCILDEIDEVLHIDSDILGFENILKGMLKTLKIALVPTYLDCVTVGDIESRFLGAGDIYILGATSGKLEASAGCGTILTLRDEEILTRCGVEIAPNAKQKLFSSMLAICEIIKKPHGMLTISYPMTCHSGALRPSNVIAEMQNLLVENGQAIRIEQIEFDRISRLDENEEKDKLIKSLFQTEKSCFHEVLRNAVSMRAPLEEMILFRSAYSFLSDENKSRLDNIFEEPKYISKKHGWEVPISTSVSRLESFFGCPYSHFLKYTLSLKKRPDGKIEGNENGLILHYILEQFYRDLRDGKLTKDNLNEMSAKYFDSAIVVCHLQLLMERQSSRRLLLRVKNESVVILSDLYAIYLRSEFKPYLLEAKIGGKDIPPMTLEVLGNSIELRGKIDRIDVLDGKFVVIDFKTYKSADLKLAELYYGEKIQLYIYMKAVEAIANMSPVGVFYLPIFEGFVNNSADRYKLKGQSCDDKKTLTEIDNLAFTKPEDSIVPIKIDKKGEFNTEVHFSRSDFDMLGDYALALATQGVIEISKGYICPTPLLDNCKFCDFAEVCAYKETNIRKTQTVKKSSFQIKGDDAKANVAVNKNEVAKANVSVDKKEVAKANVSVDKKEVAKANEVVKANEAENHIVDEKVEVQNG